VLASPFVGVSNDGLVHLRRSAERRPLFVGLERSMPSGLSERDARLMRAFRHASTASQGSRRGSRWSASVSGS
jgi:hypothetical protein